MGRADQSTEVRAMFVTPAQVNDVTRRHPEVLRARLVVEGEAGNDRMTLKCEARDRPAGLAEAIRAWIPGVPERRRGGQVVPPCSLPNNGAVVANHEEYA